MTKDKLISLIYIRAYNRPNDDNARIEPYIATMIAPSINFAITKQYYIDMRAEEYGGKDISGLFVAVYENVPVLYNDARDMYYVVMPAPMLSLPNDRGLPYIGPMAGEGEQYPIIRQSAAYTSSEYLKFIKGAFAQIEGSNILLKQHTAAVDKVLIKQVISIDGLKGSDQVPIPAGMEIDVINVAAEFVLGIRKLPQDTKADNREI